MNKLINLKMFKKKKAPVYRTINLLTKPSFAKKFIHNKKCKINTCLLEGRVKSYIL